MTPTRVAAVSGGLGGLGRATCRALARVGMQVVALDLAADAVRRAEFDADMDGHPIDVRALDVGDAAACASAVAAIEADHGRLDVLVTAAGITRDGTLRKMQRAQWDDVLRINLDGVFNLVQPAVAGMVDRGHGRIINISSVNGQTGQFGQANYAAAKAGVHGLTMALAREVARKGVTVNSISPGYCATPMVMAIPEPIRAGIVDDIPVGRLGQPDEIARVVAFLADDAAGFITGANIPVNGGMFMSF